VFPGAGLLFWWQIGAVKYLVDHFDMRGSRCVCVGASAGALAAALLAAGVDCREAAREALELARGAQVWERPMGLVGVWGRLIRAWLDALLPSKEGAVSNLGVAVMRVGVARRDQGDRWWALLHPSLRVNSWQTREELVEVLLASAHVPLVLDGRLFARVGGVGGFVDGSVGLGGRDEVGKKVREVWGEEVDVVWVDHEEDEEVVGERRSKEGGGAWRAKVPILSLKEAQHANPDDGCRGGEHEGTTANDAMAGEREPWEATWAWVEAKMAQGWAHAQRLDREGRLDGLHRL